MENLVLRALLGRLAGDALKVAIDSILEGSRISTKAAESPLGNFSPYLVRKLGMELLLQIPAEILVVDELVSAGVGEARWTTRAALIERIADTTALVISTDYEFLKQCVEDTMVLHRGGLYGPFPTELAFEYLARLRKDGKDHRPWLVSEVHGESGEDFDTLVLGQDEDEQASLQEMQSSDIPSADAHALQNRAIKLNIGPNASVQQILVDNEEYVRSKLRLLRAPGETIAVVVHVIPKKTFVCTGIGLGLYAGNGMDVGNLLHAMPPVLLTQGVPARINFELCVPDLPRNHYGLAMYLFEEGNSSSPQVPLKLMVFGLQTERVRDASLTLEVKGHAIENHPPHETINVT